MKLEDAIKQLRSLQDDVCRCAEDSRRCGENYTMWDKDVEALAVAIEALTLMMTTSTAKLSELPDNALLLIKNADNSEITIVTKKLSVFCLPSWGSNSSER